MPGRLIGRMPFMAAIVLVASTAALGQHIRTAKVYVKMDYWKPAGEQSAEAWHEDPNNNNQWTQLSNDPTSPKPPPRALFHVEDILKQSDISGNYVWFLGVSEIRVVTGSPGSFTVMSGYPEYRRMIDRAVMKWKSGTQSPGVPVGDPCGTRVWPIVTGNELTPYLLHPHPPGNTIEKYFGMKFHRQDQLGSVAWRWMNPAEITAGEDVYIEFSLKFDLNQSNTFPYYACGVSWISAAGGCDYNFCLESTQPSILITKIGTPYALGTKLVVMAVPHTLDHATDTQLYWRHLDNGVWANTLLVERFPYNNINEPAAHQCEPDGAAIPWHIHSSGENGHLNFPQGPAGYRMWQGVQAWGEGVDQIFTVAAYNVPQHANNAPINNVGLYMVFWWRDLAPEP